jgi:hypothetical protein
VNPRASKKVDAFGLFYLRDTAGNVVGHVNLKSTARELGALGVHELLDNSIVVTMPMRTEQAAENVAPAVSSEVGGPVSEASAPKKLSRKERRAAKKAQQ